ncbi:MAG: hypothetical protein ACXAE3_11505 [Candidatus Kariarchaeaceae archaeon]
MVLIAQLLYLVSKYRQVFMCFLLGFLFCMAALASGIILQLSVSLPDFIR